MFRTKTLDVIQNNFCHKNYVKRLRYWTVYRINSPARNTCACINTVTRLGCCPGILNLAAVLKGFLLTAISVFWFLDLSICCASLRSLSTEAKVCGPVLRCAESEAGHVAMTAAHFGRPRHSLCVIGRKLLPQHLTQDTVFFH
jgi:hypothetical protein